MLALRGCKTAGSLSISTRNAESKPPWAPATIGKQATAHSTMQVSQPVTHRI